jgi:hypothetical protein
MNEADLHDALRDLAGSPPPATPAARTAVAHRVRRARRRIGAVTTVLVVTAAVWTAGIVHSAASGRSDGSTVVAGRGAACPKLPRPVPRARVPAAVRAWAHGRPVVGEGSLWTARAVLRNARYPAGPRPGADGIRRFKFGWLVLPAGPNATAPSLTARALDGPGRATGEVGLGLDADGYFFASTIEVTGPSRCWQITARHGDDVITFRRVAGPPSSNFSAR